MGITQKRGISLVALIITIIVLIILTGAVIMSITGENNTMEKASEAVNKHNLSMYKEEFTRNVMQKELETNGTFDRKTLTTANLKEYVPSATDEDLANLGIKNGELVYTNTANEEEFTVAAELNMADLSKVAAGKVKVGDYIKYTPGEGTYVAKKEQTGYGTAKYIQWYNNVNSEEPTIIGEGNQTYESTVREEVLPALTLFGQTGYDNAVQELNKICSIYKDNKYAKEARSITVEDVNGVTGYSSSDMAAYGGGSSSQGGYGYKYTHNGTE